MRGIWRDRLTEIVEAAFEKSVKGKWLVTANHPMFVEHRERVRESFDRKYGKGELKEVVEAKYPALKVDHLMGEGAIKQIGRMIYLPQHEIGKQQSFKETTCGEQKREISKDDFNQLSAGIDAMLQDTSDMVTLPDSENMSLQACM